MLAVMAGCASGRDASRRPDVPDQSALAPANQALDQAINAHAQEFAPRSVDAARRRITRARDILFSAAAADRNPTAAENDQVQKLVEAARLDAREALIETQAKAVQTQLASLQNQAKGPDAASSPDTTTGSGPDADTDSGTDMGLGADNDDANGLGGI